MAIKLSYELQVAIFILCHLLTLTNSQLLHELVDDGFSPAQLYERICSGQRINLVSISQVKQLANQIQLNNQVECSNKIKQEIEALARLVSISEDNVCTNEKADALQEFTWKFIRGKFESEDLLSKSIESFFVNYGMRIGEKCRHRMIDLIMHSKLMFNEQDFKEMNKWAGEKSAISLIFVQRKSYDNLVLPKTLARSIESDASPTYVLMSTNSKIQRFQAFCERRLKPIYEPLIAPQMTLSSIGFNLLGTGIANQVKSAKDYILQWYRLVFLCESLGNIVLVDEPSNQHSAQHNGDISTGSKSKLIKIYTKDELTEMQDFKGRPIRIGLSDKVSPDIMPLDGYNPTELEPVVLDDRIYCGSDVCLNKAIKKYMDNLEYKRRNKFLTNLMEPIAHKLASGSIKLASKAFEVANYKEFIEFINEYEFMPKNQHDVDDNDNEENHEGFDQVDSRGFESLGLQKKLKMVGLSGFIVTAMSLVGLVALNAI